MRLRLVSPTEGLGQLPQKADPSDTSLPHICLQVTHMQLVPQNHVLYKVDQGPLK